MRSILIVDDELLVRRALQRLLTRRGFSVETAADSEEGLAALARRPDVQIVISDYKMPAVNGADFLEEVGQRRPDIVRVLLSGFADLAGGIDPQITFLQKPWDDDDLVAHCLEAAE